MRANPTFGVSGSKRGNSLGGGGRLSIRETCKDHDIKALTRRDAKTQVKTRGVKGEEKGGSHPSSMHTRVGIGATMLEA